MLIHRKRRIAKYTALFWTAVYTVLFAGILYNFTLVAYVMLCGDSNGTVLGLLATFCVISMPISIVFMWLYYRSQQYARLHIAWICPLVLLCLLEGISRFRMMF